MFSGLTLFCSLYPFFFMLFVRCILFWLGKFAAQFDLLPDLFYQNTFIWSATDFNQMSISMFGLFCGLAFFFYSFWFLLVELLCRCWALMLIMYVSMLSMCIVFRSFYAKICLLFYFDRCIMSWLRTICERCDV